MRNKTVLLLFYSILFLSPALLKAQMNAGELITNNKHYTIPYANTSEAIYTTAQIKGKDYKFMMDNGAPMFISTDFQKKHHFPYIVHANLVDAGGKHSGVDIVKIDAVKFGPFVFHDIPALVIDLKESPLECNGIAGNLGSNLLRFLIVQFDTQSNKIEFTDNLTMLGKQPKLWGNIWLNKQSDAWFIVKLNANLTDSVHFDTGDGSLYNISKDRAKQFSRLFSAQAIRKGFGVISMGSSGMGASFDQMMFKPQKLTIGNAVISNDVVSIAGNNLSRLGRRVFNYGVFTLDYIHKKYAFESMKSLQYTLKKTLAFTLYSTIINWLRGLYGINQQRSGQE